MTTRNLLIAAMMLANGMVAGAAAPQPLPFFESRPPAHRPTDPHEGVLVVSLASNALLLEGIDTLVVEDSSARYRLRSIATAYARDLALFIGALPEGEYRVHSVEERDSFRTLTLSDEDRTRLGSFVMRRGQRCDLGQLVLTQLTLGFMVGRT